MTDQFPQKDTIEDELAQLARQVPAIPSDYADLRRLLALLPPPWPSENPSPDVGNPALNSVGASQPSQSSSPLLGPPPAQTPSTAIAQTGVITHGWQPYATMNGLDVTDVLTTAHDLAADGGLISFPVDITAPMMLERVSVWNTDTSGARSWNWSLYEQSLSVTSSKMLNRIAAGIAQDSFTASAGSKRAIPYFNTTATPLSLNQNAPKDVCWSPDSSTAYILVANAIYILRASDNTISGAIPLQTNMYSMAISADGAYLYVSKYVALGSVFIISTATQSVVAEITGFTYPTELCCGVGSDSGYLYVVQNKLAVSGGGLAVVRLSDHLTVAFHSMDYPEMLRPSPDGNALWFLNSTNYYQAYRLQTSDHTLVGGMPTWITNSAQDLCITPDSAYVYVFCRYGPVKVIRTSDNTLVTTITGAPAGAYIYQCAMTPDGAYIYAGDGDASVFVVRTSDNTVIATLDSVASTPAYLDVTGDGQFVYVSGMDSSTVAIIRVSDNVVVDAMPVAEWPQKVLCAPNGTRTVVLGSYGTIRATAITPAFAVMVSPGVYWLAIQNTHATNTFGLGSAASGTLVHNRAQSKTIKVPNKVLANIQTNMNAYQNTIIAKADSSKIYTLSSNSDNLKEVTTSSDTVTGSVSITDGYHMCMSPDEAYAYVCRTTADEVVRVTLSTMTVTGNVAVGDAPYWVSITPDGAYLYVSNNTSSNMSVIRTSDMTVIKTITLSGNSRLNTITPDGQYVIAQVNGVPSGYYADIIRISDNTVAATIPSYGYIESLAVSHDSAYAFLGCAYILPVRMSDLTAMPMITFDYGGLDAMKITPDGTYLYGIRTDAQRIAVVRVADRQLVTDISIPADCWDGDFTPDGRVFYVPANSADSIVVIRTSDNTVVDIVKVQNYSYPNYVRVLPNGTKLYVTTQDSSPAQLHVLSAGDMSQVDFVAATWTKQTGVYAAVMEGRVFGQTSAF